KPQAGCRRGDAPAVLGADQPEPPRRLQMRYLMIVKATAQSETGVFPPDADKMFAEMAEFNNEMIAAGVMLDGACLKPSSAGHRIRFEGRGNPIVTDGPFAETKE